MTAAGPSPKFWQDKRVLVTGHTGFKGSWLCLWLQSMGAKVSGLALEPNTSPSLYEALSLGDAITCRIGDIRDYQTVVQTMEDTRPEIVIHMAAQALVRRSYVAPVETYATNLMGTAHVFEAARQVGTTRAIINVTTDKCYENREWPWGYREFEPMGGRDPYSSSKACSELVTSAYRDSYFREAGIQLASARAGNVIGGGDWSQDRLVPDILRAVERKESVQLRNPKAIRPWQHVLEPLSGYLILAEKLFEVGDNFADSWNFGPHDTDARPVEWIVEYLVRNLRHEAGSYVDQGPHPHEAHYLKLDISKATVDLRWRPRWDLETTLEKIAQWHRAWTSGTDARSICLDQIRQYGLSSEQNRNEAV